MIELAKELFKQIRSESPLQYIIPQSLAVIKKQTRWSLRGPFPPPKLKTTKNKKSSANLLKKAYDWLKQLNFLPENFQNFSFQQVKAHISKISELYLKDNKMFYPVLLTFNRLQQDDINLFGFVNFLRMWAQT